MPQAISYIRFSSSRQELGASRERQKKAVQRWLDSHPQYTLSSLIFEDLKAVTTFNAKGVEILSVDGKIMNIKPYPVQVPGLRFSLRTKDGEEVEHWSLESPKTDIPSQQSMPFSSVYPEIGENVTDLNIRFVID